MLSSKQRSYLSRLASVQKPVVVVGKDGLSESLMESFVRALEDHELVKVRFISYKEDRKALSLVLSKQGEAELVRLIGHVAIFYRPSDNPEKRHIQLP